MKAIVDTKILAGLLSASNGIAGRDTSIHLRVYRPDPTLNAGRVVFTSYDQTTVSTWEGPAQVEAEGAVALRGQALERFLKVSFRSDSTVIVESKPTNAHPALLITTARGVHEFETLSEKVFESIDPGRIDRPNGDISALARAINRARSSCAGADEVAGARLPMSGVHISLQGDEIHIVGTDSKRLAWTALLSSDHPSVSFEASPDGYTIPAPLAAKIASMIENNPARIDFMPDSLVVANDAGTLALRLINGKFPDYNFLLRKEPPHEIMFEKSDLLMALERSSAAIGGDDRNSTATIVRNSDGVHLISSTSQESSSEIIHTQGGEDAKIGFETAFMRKALANTPTNGIRLRFGDNNMPIFIDHPDRPDVLLMVMPCKTMD